MRVTVHHVQICFLSSSYYVHDSHSHSRSIPLTATWLYGAQRVVVSFSLRLPPTWYYSIANPSSYIIVYDVCDSEFGGIVCVCACAWERERENSAWMIKIVHSNTVPRLSFQLSPYTPVKAIEMKMFIKYWCSEHKISIFSQTLNYAVRIFDIPTAKMSCHNRERKIDGKRKRIYQYAVR